MPDIQHEIQAQVKAYLQTTLASVKLHLDTLPPETTAEVSEAWQVLKDTLDQASDQANRITFLTNIKLYVETVLSDVNLALTQLNSLAPNDRKLTELISDKNDLLQSLIKQLTDNGPLNAPIMRDINNERNAAAQQAETERDNFFASDDVKQTLGLGPNQTASHAVRTYYQDDAARIQPLRGLFFGGSGFSILIPDPSNLPPDKTFRVSPALHAFIATFPTAAFPAGQADHFESLKDKITTDSNVDPLPTEYLLPLLALQIKEEGLQALVQKNDDEILKVLSDGFAGEDQPFYALLRNDPLSVLFPGRLVKFGASVVGAEVSILPQSDQATTLGKLNEDYGVAAFLYANLSAPVFSMEDFLVRAANVAAYAPNSATAATFNQTYQDFIIKNLQTYPLSAEDTEALDTLKGDNAKFREFLANTNLKQYLPPLLLNDDLYLLAKIREKFISAAQAPQSVPSRKSVGPRTSVRADLLTPPLQRRVTQIVNDTPEKLYADLNRVEATLRTSTWNIINEALKKAVNNPHSGISLNEHIASTACEVLGSLKPSPQANGTMTDEINLQITHIIEDLNFLTNPFTDHAKVTSPLYLVMNAASTITAAIKDNTELSADEYAFLSAFRTQIFNPDALSKFESYYQLLTRFDVECRVNQNHTDAFKDIATALFEQKDQYLKELQPSGAPVEPSDNAAVSAIQTISTNMNAMLWGEGPVQSGEIYQQFNDSYAISLAYARWRENPANIPLHLSVLIEHIQEISTIAEQGYILPETFKLHLGAVLTEITHIRPGSRPQELVELLEVLTKITDSQSTATKPFPFDSKNARTFYESIHAKMQDTAFITTANAFESNNRLNIDPACSDANVLYLISSPKFGDADLTHASLIHRNDAVNLSTGRRIFADLMMEQIAGTLSADTEVAEAKKLATIFQNTAKNLPKMLALAEGYEEEEHEEEEEGAVMIGVVTNPLIPLIEGSYGDFATEWGALSLIGTKNSVEDEAFVQINAFFRDFTGNKENLYRAITASPKASLAEFFKSFPFDRADSELLEKLYQETAQQHDLTNVYKAILYALPLNDAARKIEDVIKGYHTNISQRFNALSPTDMTSATKKDRANIANELKNLHKFLVQLGNEQLLSPEINALMVRMWADNLEPLKTYLTQYVESAATSQSIVLHHNLLFPYIKQLIQHARTALAEANKVPTTQNAQSDAVEAIHAAKLACDLYRSDAIQRWGEGDDIVASFNELHTEILRLEAQPTAYFTSTLSRATLDTLPNENKVFTTAGIHIEFQDLHLQASAGDTEINGYAYQGREYDPAQPGATEAFYAALAKQGIPRAAIAKYFESIAFPTINMAQASCAIPPQFNYTLNLYADRNGVVHLKGTVTKIKIVIEDPSDHKLKTIDLPMLAQATYTFKDGEFELDDNGVQTNSRIAAYLHYGHNKNISNEQILLLAMIENIELPKEKYAIALTTAIETRVKQRIQDFKKDNPTQFDLLKRLLSIDPANPKKPFDSKKSLRTILLDFVNNPHHTPEQWDLFNSTLEFLSSPTQSLELSKRLTASHLLITYNAPYDRVLMLERLTVVAAEQKISLETQEGNQKTTTELAAEIITKLRNNPPTPDQKASADFMELLKPLYQRQAINSNPLREGEPLPDIIPLATVPAAAIPQAPPEKTLESLTHAEEEPIARVPAEPQAKTQAEIQAKTLANAQAAAERNTEINVKAQRIENDYGFDSYKALVYAAAKRCSPVPIDTKNRELGDIARDVIVFVQKPVAEGRTELPIITFFREVISSPTPLPNFKAKAALIEDYVATELVLDSIALAKKIFTEDMTYNDKQELTAFVRDAQALVDEGMPVTLALFNQYLTVLNTARWAQTIALHAMPYPSTAFTTAVDVLITNKESARKKIDIIRQNQVAESEEKITPEFAQLFNQSALGHSRKGSTQDAIFNSFKDTYTICKVYAAWRFPDAERYPLPYYLKVLAIEAQGKTPLAHIIEKKYYLSPLLLDHLRRLKEEIYDSNSRYAPTDVATLKQQLSTILDDRESYEDSSNLLPFDLAKTLCTSIDTQRQDDALLDAALLSATPDHNDPTLTDAAILTKSPQTGEDQNTEFAIGRGRTFLDNQVLSDKDAINAANPFLGQAIDHSVRLIAIRDIVTNKSNWSSLLEAMEDFASSILSNFQAWSDKAIKDLVVFLQNLPATQAKTFNELYEHAHESMVLPGRPQSLMMMKVLAALAADNTEQKIARAIDDSLQAYNQEFLKFLRDPRNDGTSLLPYIGAFEQLKDVLNVAGYADLFPQQMMSFETIKKLKESFNNFNVFRNNQDHLINLYFTPSVVQAFATLLSLELPADIATLTPPEPLEQLILAAEQRTFQFTPVQQILYKNIKDVLENPNIAVAKLRFLAATLENLSDRDSETIKDIKAIPGSERFGGAVEEQYRERITRLTTLRDDANTVVNATKRTDVASVEARSSMHPATLEGPSLTTAVAGARTATATKVADVNAGTFPAKYGGWLGALGHAFRTYIAAPIYQFITAPIETTKAVVNYFFAPPAPPAEPLVSSAKQVTAEKLTTLRPDLQVMIKSASARLARLNAEREDSLRDANNSHVTLGDLEDAIKNLEGIHHLPAQKPAESATLIAKINQESIPESGHDSFAQLISDLKTYKTMALQDSQQDKEVTALIKETREASAALENELTTHKVNYLERKYQHRIIQLGNRKKVIFIMADTKGLFTDLSNDLVKPEIQRDPVSVQKVLAFLRDIETTLQAKYNPILNEPPQLGDWIITIRLLETLAEPLSHEVDKDTRKQLTADITNLGSTKGLNPEIETLFDEFNKISERPKEKKAAAAPVSPRQQEINNSQQAMTILLQIISKTEPIDLNNIHITMARLDRMLERIKTVMPKELTATEIEENDDLKTLAGYAQAAETLKQYIVKWRELADETRPLEQDRILSELEGLRGTLAPLLSNNKDGVDLLNQQLAGKRASLALKAQPNVAAAAAMVSPTRGPAGAAPVSPSAVIPTASSIKSLKREIDATIPNITSKDSSLTLATGLLGKVSNLMLVLRPGETETSDIPDIQSYLGQISRAVQQGQAAPDLKNPAAPTLLQIINVATTYMTEFEKLLKLPPKDVDAAASTLEELQKLNTTLNRIPKTRENDLFVDVIQNLHKTINQTIQKLTPEARAPSPSDTASTGSGAELPVSTRAPSPVPDTSAVKEVLGTRFVGPSTAPTPEHKKQTSTVATPKTKKDF